MLKNTLISEEENRVYVEFQVFWFTKKIQRLHIWNCTKKTIYLKEVYDKYWENVNDCWPIWQKKNTVHYQELISQLNIRKIKTP